jgi:ribosome-associated protein
VLRDIRIAAATLDDHKAVDLVVLDLRGLSDATDYFVLASGTSDTHVRALTEHVIEALRKVNRRAHHAEGVKAGRWALLDYVDFVVHVFHPTLREFYQLERLWVDAPAVSVQLNSGSS